MRINRIFIILTFIITVFSNLSAHPVHISVVNMDVTEDGRILFSVKIFTDDFENAINTENNTNISFTKNMALSSVEEYVTSYISNNLIINSDSINLSSEYKFVKMEMDTESVWFFFEIENKNYNFGKLIVENTLMCNLFQDQTNLFIISIKGKEEAYRFNNKNRKKSFVRK